MLIRQGDVFLEPIEGLPSQAARRADLVVAEGESTGHQHRILDPGSAQLLSFRGNLFLDVVAEFAQLVHDEHATVWLEHGQYRVWFQREYDPHAGVDRLVID